jgi:hypothetical protein
MLTHLPLDDQLNRVFYIEGGLWRLVYAFALGRCVYRREAPHIELDHAIKLIADGELLWTPPATFERFDAGTPLDEVRTEHALLWAFLRSPAARRITHRGMRTRLEERLSDDRAWLARRAITHGDVGDPGDEGEQ